MVAPRSPRVTVHENVAPSEALVRAAAAEVDVSDGAHTYTLRKPGILAQVNLIKVLGEDAKNEMLRDIYAPLTYLKAIDGELIAAPQNMIQLNALLQRVEEEGVVAIMTGVVKHYGAPNTKAEHDAVKN